MMTVFDRETDLQLIQHPQLNGIYVMYLNDLIHLAEFAQARHTHMNMALDDAAALDSGRWGAVA
jgi:hypothetical protein